MYIHTLSEYVSNNRWNLLLYSVPMYIESVPNRHSPPAIFLCESFRQGGKVCKRARRDHR